MSYELDSSGVMPSSPSLEESLLQTFQATSYSSLDRHLYGSAKLVARSPELIFQRS